MGTSLPLLDISIFVVCILIAMTVHEAMHAYAGFLLGDTTAAEEGRISLNPLRHIDPLFTVVLPVVTYLLFGAPILAAKPVPFNPERVKYGEFGAALIAAAGPLSNLAMAAIAALVYNTSASGSLISYALGSFILLNVNLFVFNLIPIPPLDGSRVLYAFAPESLQRVMAEIERYGLFIVFGLVLIPGFGNLLINLNNAILQLLHVV